MIPALLPDQAASGTPLSRPSIPSVQLNSAQLTLDSSVGYSPSPGDAFTIIHGNVVGTFNGLPERG